MTSHAERDRPSAVHSQFHQLVESLVEDGALGGGQPELGVVEEGDGRPLRVQVRVDAAVVRLVPLAQRPVHLLHHVVHHAPVGRVADEQQLQRNAQC